MKSTELRLGNHVINNFYKSEDIIKVTSIYTDINGIEMINIYQEHSELCSHIEGVELRHCSPIHLSPDILLKAGFTKIPSTILGDNVYQKDNYYLTLDEGFYSLDRSIDDSFQEWDHIYPDLLYLHQLQNLYFALTGTELGINLV